MAGGTLQYGVVYSWPNIQPIIAGVPFLGIASIKFNAKRAKTNVYGVGAEPIGRGQGKKTYEGCTVRILLEDWKRIIAASPQGDPTMLAPFSIKLPFTPSPNSPVLPMTDTLQNCEFESDGNDYSEGDTAFWKDVPVIYAGQKRN